MQSWLQRFNQFYLVWLVSLSAVAFVWPPTMLWFDKPWIFWSLAASMLGMGLTIRMEDFRQVAGMPGSIVTGFALQYSVMPLCGWLVATTLRLEPGLAVGIILVASCPGGMASNMICYLAKANVAASVVLTLASTVMAFVMTPLWTSVLAGKIVPVDVIGMCLSALQLTVAPVVLGVLIRWKLPRTADTIGSWGPSIAVLAFTCVTAGIVAASASEIASGFGRLLTAAVLLHLIGFGVGYGLARLLKYPESLARTVSIEVGMQNGGLAASLAREHFAAMPLAAAAAVFSGVIQNVIGGIVAVWWKRTDADELHATPAE
ncbi:MAG: bile acid:sodium symporter family protein [Planctomycetaceae bacterium]